MRIGFQSMRTIIKRAVTYETFKSAGVNARGKNDAIRAIVAVKFDNQRRYTRVWQLKQFV